MLLRFIAIIAVLLGSYCRSAVSQLDRSVPSYRIVHIDDLVSNPATGKKHKRFGSIEDGSEFTQFAVHFERDSIFLGSNNSVLRLSFDEFHKVDQVIWSLPQKYGAPCSSINGSKIGCQFSSVSLLVPVDDVFFTANSKAFRSGLYACLTDGSSSECTLRQAADLRGPPKTHWKDLAHRPVTDYSQVVGIATSNRYLYVATRFGNSSASKNVIMRIAAETETVLKASGPKIIETPVGSNWIMQDERTAFIGAFEFHNAVYFIFRETAHEALESCQSQVTVSRIGRVCLSDNGGPRKKLESFTKATLVCPSENNAEGESTTFIFNEVQSIQIDQGTKTLFAAFTTSSSIPPGSVVCAYRLTDIEDAFKGPFHIANGQATKFESSGDCTRPNMNVFSTHRLMYRVIKPRQGYAILKKDGVRWSRLVVDWAPHTPKTDNNLVLFTMDTKGILSKWHVFKGESCLIEQIHFQLRSKPMDALQIVGVAILPVNKNSKSPSSGALIVVTKSDVFRLPASRCGLFGHLREICETIQDPYCGWNMQTERCEELTTQTEHTKHVVRFDMCAPDLKKEPKFSIDGQWGAWSAWSACSMSGPTEEKEGWMPEHRSSQQAQTVARSLEVHGCQCRYRLCSAPYPFGQQGKKCMEGPAAQTTNCSISGGWTVWSSWSGCEPACRPAETSSRQEDILVPARTRQRWCLNPAPLGPHGEQCIGAGKESQPCIGPLPMCLDQNLPIPGWSQWSQWSDCSTSCNGGRRIRWRQCIREEMESAPPKLDKSTYKKIIRESLDKTLCLGEAFEEQECNTQPCPVNKVTSAWTTWYVAEGDKATGTLERCYRVECVANVPEVDKLQATMQLQNGECEVGANGVLICQEPTTSPVKETVGSESWLEANLENRWSVWTVCSRPCGGGTRFRWRPRRTKRMTATKGKQSQNPEVDKQEEACNTHSCPGHWSCWTHWSACTEPPCSENRGEQRRYRSCLIPSSLTLPFGESPDINLCSGGEEHSVQSRPCEVTVEDVQCRNTAVNVMLKSKRTMPLDGNTSESTSVYTRKGEVTPWAAWSDCFRPSGLDYDVRVRAREDCLDCEVVQAKRCDSDQFVPVAEILAADSAIHSAGQKSAQPAKNYTLTHAIVVAVFGALLGVTVVLVPYLIYTMTERKQREQRDRANRSQLWQKLVNDKYHSDRSLPYIWVAETDEDDKRNRKQLNKKRMPSHRETVTKTRSNWNPVESGGMLDTLQNQAALSRRPFAHPSLTRIQALHNDHRTRPPIEIPSQEEHRRDTGPNNGPDGISLFPNYESASPRVQTGASNGTKPYGVSSRSLQSQVLSKSQINGKPDQAVIYASAPCH
ncbi:hypothetical protein CRM22_008918 [Opisthorchis felineus]|uniref:Sema domain-containing protein n=1 Tax=Opisthorchis felineus TaxID=147828 RepID=A0A4S2L9S4_OPIFE|nr:hypothetical protein CRM22_008918 [Opisthorchis felineus]